MAIDERTRHEMYLGLEQLLGPHVADALMEHLPPVGWADVATTRELDALEERPEDSGRLREHGSHSGRCRELCPVGGEDPRRRRSPIREMMDDPDQPSNRGEWRDWRVWRKIAGYWILAAGFLVVLLLICAILIVALGGLEFNIS